MKKILVIFMLFWLLFWTTFSYNHNQYTNNQTYKINEKTKLNIDWILKNFYWKLQKKYPTKEKQLYILNKINRKIFKLKKNAKWKKYLLLQYIFDDIILNIWKIKSIDINESKKYFWMNWWIFCMWYRNFDKLPTTDVQKEEYIRNRFRLLKHLWVDIIRQLRFADTDLLWNKYKTWEIIADDDFFILDTVVNEAKDNHIDIVFTLFWNIQRWSTLNEKFWNTSDDYEKANEYVDLIVNRYKWNNIYWEVWNEIIQFTETDESRDILFHISKNTYTKIKDIDSTSKVLLPWLNWTKNDKFDNTILKLRRLITKHPSFLNYFDIYGFHYYWNNINDLSIAYDNFKTTIWDNKEIWVTETWMSSHENWMSDEIFWTNLTEEKQAKHLVQRMLIFFEKWAKKVFWHNMQYTLSEWFHWCNLHWDLNLANCSIDDYKKSPKSSYYNYKLLSEKIWNFTKIYKHKESFIWKDNFEIFDVEFEPVFWIEKKLFIIWNKVPGVKFDLKNLWTSWDNFKITYAFKELINKKELSVDSTWKIKTTNTPKIKYVSLSKKIWKLSGIVWKIDRKINLDDNIIFVEKY
jgi:hypothetical protein